MVNTFLLEKKKASYVKLCSVNFDKIGKEVILYFSISCLCFIADNIVSVHDLATFGQITVLSKTRGASLFAVDVQVLEFDSFCACYKIHVVLFSKYFFLYFPYLQKSLSFFNPKYVNIFLISPQKHVVSTYVFMEN